MGRLLHGLLALFQPLQGTQTIHLQDGPGAHFVIGWVTQEKCYRRLGIAPPGKGRGRGSPAMSQNAAPHLAHSKPLPPRHRTATLLWLGTGRRHFRSSGPDTREDATPHHFSGILSIGYILSRRGDTLSATWRDSPPSQAVIPSPGPPGITTGPDPEISSPASPPSSPTAPSPTLGHGKRQKKAPFVLKDYVCHTAQVLPPPASSTPINDSSSPRYPLANFVSCKSFSTANTQFLDAVSSGSEPRSYKAASHDPKWRVEIDALEANVSLFPTLERRTLGFTMFFSTHYAREHLRLKFSDGEPWKMVFGPVFVYLNSVSHDEDPLTLWADAKEQMSIETESWPYDFPLSEDYLLDDQRGMVSGRLLVRHRYLPMATIRNQLKESACIPTIAFAVLSAKAMIMMARMYQFCKAMLYVQQAKSLPTRVWLAPARDVGSWQTENKGYRFWTQADVEGYFLIKGVLPGNYSLYAWVPGTIGDYKYDAYVKVTPGLNI
ncbi:LOW QUALITY PROTEIN: hypothetical protein RJ640_000678 [Escallonia rubra]|uniref:Rhamnogalacturonan lyase domain-containing protein n=1 Tax=Escallonia rubra TaxID=112253 RepID=A0AA88QYK3_9ASTE|nr:LOW QUALITY PROTEIN: hypothetical protein RJ640_000678 [Escallonia rubra]